MLNCLVFLVPKILRRWQVSREFQKERKRERDVGSEESKRERLRGEREDS